MNRHSVFHDNAADCALLHILLDTLPDMVWLKDMNGVYLACNRRFERFFGAQDKDIIGKTDHDFVDKEQADFFREQDRKAVKKDGPSVYEEWVTYADDGHRELLETIKTPMRDGSGKLLGVLGIARDITGRMKAEEMLRKLSAAVDQSAASVVIADLEACIQYVNPRFTANTGYSVAEVIGKNPRILQSGQTSKETYQELWGMLASGQEWNGELLNKRKNGELYWEDVSIAPIRDAVGGITHYVGIKTDITERKRMEAALAENERRYRTLIENSPFCIHEIDLHGRLQSMNRAGLDMLGLDDEKMICGLPYLNAVSVEDSGRIKALLQEAIGGTPSHFEFASTGDEPLYFKSCFIPIKDDGGRVLKLMGITEDISERSRIETERRKLSSVLVQSGEAVALTDTGARYVYANPAFCKLFGYEPDELIGNSISLLMPPDDISGANFRQTTASALEQGAFQGEVRRRAKDGAIIPVLLKVTPFRDERGSFMGYIASMTDLTETKRMEDALRESEKHFRDIMEHAPLGTVTVTLGGRFIHVNQAFCEIVGYPREVLENLSFGAITYPADIDVSLENIRQLMSGQIDSYRIDKRYIHRDGHIVWAQVDTSLHRGLSGEPQYLICQIRDITVQKQAEQALLHSLKQYGELVQRIPVGVFKFRMSPEGISVFKYVSPRWCELLDVSEEEIMRDPQAYMARIHTAELGRFIRLNEDARKTRGPFVWEGRVQRKNGEIRWQHIESQPTLQENGDILWDGIQYDITARHAADEALRTTASVFDNCQEAIVITSPENIILDVNPAFTHITGYSRKEVLGHNPKLLSSGRQDQSFYAEMWQTLEQKKAWRGEIWNRRKSGEVYAEQLSIAAVYGDDGRVQRYVGVFSDISHFKYHEAELSRVANYDALTGLPNRRMLADRMRQAIARAQRSGKLLAVCYLDLDGFKQVNDLHGHQAGDQLLVDMTRRLQETMRAGDTLARLGGDEFVVLFNDLAREQECLQMLGRILDNVNVPVIIGKHAVNVTASIGVSFYPSDNEDGDTLLRHADQAMYVAKQTGKSRYYLYDPIHDQRIRALHESRRRIMLGLEQDEFELFYQPKIDLASGEVAGVEALIRWHHPERGLLLPADFLPFIEDSDLEIRLGEWVMDTALAQLGAWHEGGLALEVSINISAHHLQSPDFVSELERKLAQYPQLARDRLQIEVLETAALQDIAQSAETIDACRKLGVNFALDDFGTGFSSLAYLRRLSAETLKIDQSFVRGMLADEGDRAIVQGIIALAKSFGRKTVAEGLEQPELIQELLEIGCMYGQGYGIAHPMTAGKFLQWHKNRK